MPKFLRSEAFWLTAVADVAAVLVVALPLSAHLVQAIATGAAGIITAAYVHGASAPTSPGTATPAPATSAPAPAQASAPVSAAAVAEVLSSAASALRQGS